jgi:hypothetical protein
MGRDGATASGYLKTPPYFSPVGAAVVVGATEVGAVVVGFTVGALVVVGAAEVVAGVLLQATSTKLNNSTTPSRTNNVFFMKFYLLDYRFNSIELLSVSFNRYSVHLLLLSFKSNIFMYQ